jgi:hypothetical protein
MTSGSLAHCLRLLRNENSPRLLGSTGAGFFDSVWDGRGAGSLNWFSLIGTPK